MKTIFISILLSLLVISGKIYAQLENIPLITVIGESALKVKSDYCILGIRIEKSIPSNSNRDPMGFEIFNAEDMRLSLFNIDDNNVIETKTQIHKNKLVREIFITVKDLNKLDKVLIDLAKSGFDDYVYVDYRIEDYKSLKNKARVEALRSAKNKASDIAFEMDQSIGKAHIIEELEVKSYNMFNMENYSEIKNLTYNLGADNYIIEPGLISVTTKLKVSFNLFK